MWQRFWLQGSTSTRVRLRNLKPSGGCARVPLWACDSIPGEAPVAPAKPMSAAPMPLLGSGTNTRTRCARWRAGIVWKSSASTRTLVPGAPGVWQEVAQASLALVREFPEVRTLNLGGGYKVARVAAEKETDLQAVGAPVRAAFEAFAVETGRTLHLEIEPGTYLVANAGVLLARVQDITDTGLGGRCFLKLDTGMTELLRPTLYGAQHPLEIVPADATAGGAVPECDYIVVGHCCESGDLVTCAPGMPEVLAARRLRQAQPGDLCMIGGAGAYCAAMSAKNYNSFPEAPEVLVGVDGVPRLIRQRQTLEQMVQNELDAG